MFENVFTESNQKKSNCQIKSNQKVLNTRNGAIQIVYCIYTVLYTVLYKPGWSTQVDSHASQTSYRLQHHSKQSRLDDWSEDGDDRERRERRARRESEGSSPW